MDHVAGVFMSKIRVAFVCDYFPPVAPGGSAWSVAALADAICSDVALHVVTPDYSTFMDTSSGVYAVHRFPFPDGLTEGLTLRYRYSNSPASYLRTARRIAAIVRRESIQIINVHDYKMSAMGALVAGMSMGIPVVVTLRDTSALCPLAVCLETCDHIPSSCSTLRMVRTCSKAFESRGPQEPRSAISRLRSTAVHGGLHADVTARRHVLRRASGFIAVSRALLNLHREMGIAVREPSAVIPNLIGEWLTDSLSEQRSTNAERELSPHRVLFAPGKLSPGKGALVFALAAELVRSQRQDVSFVAVGNGEPAIKRVLERSGVEVLPKMSRRELASVYMASTVVAVPSVSFEAFGRTALEGMAAGKAVVVSDAGGLPELTKGGRCGLVVRRNDGAALADAITTLVSNPTMREALGRAGRSAVETNYTTEQVAARTIRFYGEVMYR